MKLQVPCRRPGVMSLTLFSLHVLNVKNSTALCKIQLPQESSLRLHYSVLACVAVKGLTLRSRPVLRH